jgi:hypothetical protein
VNAAEAVKELALTLADVLECGDLRGHLAAWWGVVSGRVDMDAPAIQALDLCAATTVTAQEAVAQWTATALS